MLVLRSVAFGILFYGNLIAWMLVCWPTFFLPRRYLLACIRGVFATGNWLMRHVVGLEVEVRGYENLPASGCIIASKHQSMWETVSLFHVFPDPAFVYKRELGLIPLFGWYARKSAMIAVDRGKGSQALKSMVENSREAVADGRQIMIYPEGTRRPPGAEPAYKYGIVKLYQSLGVPVVPVALNSGVYWPRRTLIKYPGKVVMEILPPIAPGLDDRTFFDTLQATIEAASDRLIAEAAAAPDPSPVALRAARRSA